MEWWEAVILGVVEGLTEYLPVSSTGHLLLAQRAMGILASGEANAFAICIQAGAIVAVLGLYRRRVWQMAAGLWGRLGLGPGEPDGWRLACNLIVAFIPAAVFGLLLGDWIELRLFGLWPIVWAWFVGGAAILAVAWWRAPQSSHAARLGMDQLTWRRAAVIGLLQCLALWPGVSRSLVTIVGGLLVGLQVTAAVEFSFLLGVMTLLAATGYKAVQMGPAMLASYGWQPLVLGGLAAWISAVAAVRWMIHFLKRYGLSVFGYYRVGLAVGVALLILYGHLEA